MVYEAIKGKGMKRMRLIVAMALALFASQVFADMGRVSHFTYNSFSSTNLQE